jgi:hypothetical protein
VRSNQHKQPTKQEAVISSHQSTQEKRTSTRQQQEAEQNDNQRQKPMSLEICSVPR